MLTVLLGGARSGKSALAEQIATASRQPVVFVATGPIIGGDDDLATRVARHRADRPDAWGTIEEELDLAGALRRCGDAVVIVDCLTTWIGSLQHHRHHASEIDRASEAALTIAADRAGDTIVVTNEVGLGIVPDNALAREYRDLLGRVNRRWVAAADEAWFLIAGRAIPLHDLDELPR